MTYTWSLCSAGTATVNGVVHDFQIKHYDESSVYGIAHGRVSKLWLRRRGDAHAVLSFDRGWERGFTPRGKGAEDIAERIGRDVSYVARIIRMADLAPSIVHSIIAGDCPDRLSLDMLKNCLPIEWEEQRGCS